MSNDYAQPIIDNYGPHRGCNADWNSRTWKLKDHYFILDDEDGNTFSVVHYDARVMLEPSPAYISGTAEEVLAWAEQRSL